jgi:hypothetical protein
MGDIVFNEQITVTKGYNELNVDIGLARGNIFQCEVAFITVDTSSSSEFSDRHWCNGCQPERIFCEENFCDSFNWAINRRGAITFTVDYSLNEHSYQFMYEKSFNAPGIYTLTAEISVDSTKNVGPFSIKVEDLKSIRLFCQKDKLFPMQNVTCYVHTNSFQTNAEISVDFGDGSPPITVQSSS